MIYIRGNRGDYDMWRQAGNSGWGYADVLPYFKRLENNWRGENEYHGAGGPVDIQNVVEPDNHFEEIRAAAEAAGIPFTEDANGAQQEGISRIEQNTTKDGRRASTARAYLYPAMGRPNLTIETGAITSRILIAGGKATGVEYIKSGQKFQAFAEREVCLSGGAFNSPQILMLSGIGPADHLREVGHQAAARSSRRGAESQRASKHPARPSRKAGHRPDEMAAARPRRPVGGEMVHASGVDLRPQRRVVVDVPALARGAGEPGYPDRASERQQRRHAVGIAGHARGKMGVYRARRRAAQSAFAGMGQAALRQSRGRTRASSTTCSA